MKVRIKTDKDKGQKAKSDSLSKPTSDSSEHYLAEAIVRDINVKGLLPTSKEQAKIKESTDNANRQKNKGKPGYDKNGFYVKYVGNFPTTDNIYKK